MTAASFQTFPDLVNKDALVLKNPSTSYTRTAMDLAFLADATLLHEMTHAITTVNVTEDLGYGKNLRSF